MKFKSHLQIDNTPPTVGRESFGTFLQVAEQVAKYAVDDLSLASQNACMKAFVCWVLADQQQQLAKLFARYATMRAAGVWMEKVFTEAMRVGLFYALHMDETGEWHMRYGLTDGANLYLVGDFPYRGDEDVPKSPVTKHYRNEFVPFDPEVHGLLELARRAMRTYNPGPCALSEPQVVDGGVTLAAHMLGNWNQGQVLEWGEGEAQKYVAEFQKWVREQPWWDRVQLVLRVVGNGWVYFIVKPKDKEAAQ